MVLTFTKYINVKTIRRIGQIFLAFSEKLYFINLIWCGPQGKGYFYPLVLLKLDFSAFFVKGGINQHFLTPLLMLIKQFSSELKMDIFLYIKARAT